MAGRVLVVLFTCPPPSHDHTSVSILQVHCSIAVQTAAGLMVPVVRNAEKKGLAAISSNVKELAAKAR